MAPLNTQCVWKSFFARMVRRHNWVKQSPSHLPSKTSRYSPRYRNFEFLRSQRQLPLREPSSRRHPQIGAWTAQTFDVHEALSMLR